MKAWTPKDDDASFELTSMIDVVFLLIAFFMTVTSFASSELVKVEMPLASESKVPEEAKDRQFVTIDVKGNYFLGGRHSNLDEIQRMVAKRGASPSFKGVYLRADTGTPFKYVSELLEKCAEVGVFNIIFGTEQE